MKKLISILLATLLIVGMIPASVFAATTLASGEATYNNKTITFTYNDEGKLKITYPDRSEWWSSVKFDNIDKSLSSNSYTISDPAMGKHTATGNYWGSNYTWTVSLYKLTVKEAGKSDKVLYSFENSFPLSNLGLQADEDPTFPNGSYASLNKGNIVLGKNFQQQQQYAGSVTIAKHDFEYAANGSTITATCKNATCTLTDKKVAVSIKDTDLDHSKPYDGNAYKTISIDNGDNFKAATGKDATLSFVDSNSDSIEVDNIKEIGTYTAKLSAAGKEATLGFEIVAAEQNATLTMDNYWAGKTPSTPSVTLAEGATPTYSYKAKDAQTYTAWNTSEPPVLETGSYTMKAEWAATDHYAAGSTTKDFNVNGLMLTPSDSQSVIQGGSVNYTVALQGYSYSGYTNEYSVVLEKYNDTAWEKIDATTADVKITNPSYFNSTLNVEVGAKTPLGKYRVTLTGTNKNTPAETASVTREFTVVQAYKITVKYLDISGSVDYRAVITVPQTAAAGAEVSIGMPGSSYVKYIYKIFNGNTEITNGKFTMPSQDVELTVYRAADKNKVHTVTINSSISGGTVTTDLATAPYAYEGTNITVTATPKNENYVLSGVQVTKSPSGAVIVNQNKFAMPAADVTVSATFKEKLAISNFVGANATYDGTVKAGCDTTKTLTFTDSSSSPITDPTGLVYKYYKNNGTTETPNWSSALASAPKDAGSYKVVVSVPDTNTSYFGSAEALFSIDKATITVTPTANQEFFLGVSPEVIQYTPTGVAAGETFAKTGALKVNVSESDKAISEVAAPGTYTITLGDLDLTDGAYGNQFKAANYTLALATTPVTCKVVKNINTVGIITLLGDPLIENGAEQTQEFEVKDGTTVLKKGVDYTVVDNSDKKTTAGDYTLKIAGAGNYGGELTKKFDVLPSSGSPSGITVTFTDDTTDDIAHIDDSEGSVAQAVATAEELSAVAAGTNLVITLTVDEASSHDGVDTELAKITDAKEAVFYNITITKKFGSAEAVSVTETSKPITITLNLPDWGEPADGATRKVYLLREHVGDAQPYTVIEGVVNEEANTVTFSSKLFSTYALYYVDSSTPVYYYSTKKVEKPTTWDKCKKNELCPIEDFGDLVATQWYHDGIHFCLDNGLMKGVTATTFAPNATTTRAMMMTILARMDGCDTEGGEKWYSVGQSWAITNEISDGTNPDAVITREQFATMLYRYAKSQGKGFVGTWMFNLEYSDAADVSDFANEAIHWCVMKGILTGYADGTLLPGATLTRAEAATMIQRYCTLK